MENMSNIKRDGLRGNRKIREERRGGDRRLYGDRRGSARRHLDRPEPALTSAEIAALLRVGERGE